MARERVEATSKFHFILFVFKLTKSYFLTTLLLVSVRRGKDELSVQALRGGGDHLSDGRSAGVQQQRDCELQRTAGQHADEREGAPEDH